MTARPGSRRRTPGPRDARVPCGPRPAQGIYKPSPAAVKGSFLRSFTWGNVRQLEKVHRELLAGLAGLAPLLPGAGQLAFIDMDSMQRGVYGHAKQGQLLHPYVHWAETTAARCAAGPR